MQRYKMKIVQYCRMLRKLAILYDIGPIILLPFYPLRISDAAELRRTQPQTIFLPFYLFTLLLFYPFYLSTGNT